MTYRNVGENMGKYDGSLKFDTRVNSKGFNDATQSMTNNVKGLITSLKAAGAAIAGAFIVKAIVNTVQEAEKLQNAMTGLKSIMDGQGKSFAKATEFIKSYTEDGLIPQTEAITAYKNLALRGYDTTQIQKVMTALKDSATFGRQASYTLGEAVAGASEGLKNENSILVDNAGVTKNVAKMWEDYAKSIGKTSNNLTKQEKIQAEVNGILEETKYQTGDAITYADSYSGMIARINASFITLKQTIGGAFMQIFQAVLPLVQTVINALISLAQVFAGVVSLIFNKQVKVNGNVATSSNKAASAISAQGDAAEKAGKQAEDALLPFDKLNVLSEESTGNGGGASSSIPEIQDLNNLEIGSNITLSPRVQEVFDYLKDLASGINFDNIGNSLGNLKQVIEPLTETIFSGLKWGLENVIMPIAQFTINTVLPSFLDILSGSLSILNSVLIGFQPFGMWLWDNFLSPMASWAGGAIGATLTTVANILQQISDWAKENQSTVDIMVTSFTIFFGLWKLTELLAFIQMSGGLVTAFTIITNAIKACTIAKVADKLETIALTLMYAKDFIVSLGSGTVALTKQLIQWGLLTGAKTIDIVQTGAVTVAQLLWNTTATIGATITTALGAAFVFLTSPIGLAILAIGALIAIGTLLWQNWDKVKEIGGILGNSLITIFQNVGTIIGNIFKGIVNTISTAINIVTTVLNGFMAGILAPFNAIIWGLNQIPGVRIPSLSISIPKIPMLATGAVIPPNAQFMAVLGDQKNGNNIETPEKLLRQIVREEGSGTKTIIVKTYLDKRQIAESIEEVKRDETASQNDYSIGGGAFAY